MKKITTILAVVMTLCFASTAMACPRGTHPHGGTGSHHAGGTCY